MRAETVKIGILRVASMTPLFIADDRGYFRDENLTPEIVFIDAPALIASGVISGDLDFGLTGFGADLFNLGAQGGLRLIGGSVQERPGFPANAIAVSNAAYDAGLTSPSKLGGHAEAIAGAGDILSYATSAVARKEGFDYASIKMVPLGAIPNLMTAVLGGAADFSLLPNFAVQGPAAAHKLHVIGMLGDEIPLQLNVIITSAKTADSRGDTVRRFLRAERKGVADYRQAFVGADGKRQDGPGSAAILDLASKHLGQPPEVVSKGIAYVDANVSLDPITLQQLDWFKSGGMVRAGVDVTKIIDTRYTAALQ